LLYGAPTTKNSESYYLKAIQIDPQFSYSYYYLLQLYTTTNQKEKAKQFLEKKMLSLFPHDTQLKDLYNNLINK
jgi:hypothetical protein